jgi:hypothetical protein
MARKKRSPEIDIKIRNIDKSYTKGKCYFHHSSNFWIFGSALAMILSYTRSSSILWAILHGITSWFYIAFRAMQIWGWF